MVQAAMKYVLQLYTALDVNKVVIAPHVIIYMDAPRPLKEVGKDKFKFSSVLNMLMTILFTRRKTRYKITLIV